eukprot:1188435-Prorocentrum_minimum.AAC.3
MHFTVGNAMRDRVMSAICRERRRQCGIAARARAFLTASITQPDHSSTLCSQRAQCSSHGHALCGSHRTENFTDCIRIATLPGLLQLTPPFDPDVFDYAVNISAADPLPTLAYMPVAANARYRAWLLSPC